MVRLSVGFRSIRSIERSSKHLRNSSIGTITGLMEILIYRLLNRYSGKEHIYLGDSSNGQNGKTKDFPDTTRKLVAFKISEQLNNKIQLSSLPRGAIVFQDSLLCFFFCFS